MTLKFQSSYVKLDEIRKEGKSMTNHKEPQTSHEIVLFTSQIEYICMNISKEKFIEYKDVGVPFDEYDEFNDSSDYCEAIYDELTMLTVDDEEINDFNSFMDSAYANFLKQKDAESKEPPISNEKNISYAIAGEKWIKRSWYSATIYEEFNIKNLRVEFCRNLQFDNSIQDTFTLFYKDQKIEFSESNDSNYDEEYLITSEGERFDFTQID